jgi:hypothetical protein
MAARLRNSHHMPTQSEIGDDTPLRLAVAAAFAYPDGSMTASGLRREAARGRLVIGRQGLHHAPQHRRDEGSMPRPAKGARLWLRPERRTPDGSIRERAVWLIRDGSRRISTGCVAANRAGAERALGEHLARKYQPSRSRGRHPTEILIADVLAIYLTDVAPRHARENETKQRVLTLDGWWADKTLAEVNGANCRAYVEHRIRQHWKSSKPEKTGTAPRMVTIAAARRELEDLRSAINHHRREGLCSEIVSVVLPARPDVRERWLTGPPIIPARLKLN